jgi:hypothetical protein
MRFASIFLAVILAGCPDEGTTTADAAALSCECPTPAAETTTYDNVASMLSGDNVQDAVDELAARPSAEQVLAAKVEKVSRSVTNSGETILTGATACPDESRDIAIGGSCGVHPDGELKGFVVRSTASQAAFECTWGQPLNDSTNLVVEVVCLRNVR